MSDSAIEISQPQDQRRGHIRLPVLPGDFKDFIVGLLGRPQTIERVVSGPFRADREDLLSIHDSIEQRVSQQNQGELVQLVVVVGFNDGSSVQLSGINEFTTYNEIRQLRSTTVTLEWTYLIRFADKEVPERQIISITLDTRGVKVRRSSALRADDDVEVVETNRSGHIHLRIAHTARTCGADMEAMLTVQLEGLVRPVPAHREFVDQHSGKIGLAMFCLFFGGSVIATFGIAKLYASRRVEAMNAQLASLEGGDMEVVAGQLAYLTDAVTQGIWAQHYFQAIVFVLVAFVLSSVCSIMSIVFATYRGESFLLLTKKSGKHMERKLKSEKKGWWAFLKTVAFSVAMGVLGNVCFYYLQCHM